LKNVVHNFIENTDEKYAQNHKAITDLTIKVNQLVSMAISLNFCGKLLNEIVSCEDGPIDQKIELCEKVPTTHGEYPDPIEKADNKGLVENNSIGDEFLLEFSYSHKLI